MTTLMNERVGIGRDTPPRGFGPIGRAIEVSKSIGLDDPVQLDRLLRLWVPSRSEPSDEPAIHIGASSNRSSAVFSR